MIHIKNLMSGSLNMVVFASKKRGRKIKIKLLMAATVERLSLERRKASTNPKIQNGSKILYSKIPKNLLE